MFQEKAGLTFNLYQKFQLFFISKITNVSNIPWLWIERKKRVSITTLHKFNICRKLINLLYIIFLYFYFNCSGISLTQLNIISYRLTYTSLINSTRSFFDLTIHDSLYPIHIMAHYLLHLLKWFFVPNDIAFYVFMGHVQFQALIFRFLNDLLKFRFEGLEKSLRFRFDRVDRLFDRRWKLLQKRQQGVWIFHNLICFLNKGIMLIGWKALFNVIGICFYLFNTLWYGFLLDLGILAFFLEQSTLLILLMKIRILLIYTQWIGLLLREF